MPEWLRHFARQEAQINVKMVLVDIHLKHQLPKGGVIGPTVP